ncbi:hypothetical protein [Brachybacterium vulturis]|uniref:hypothetical protein n=1 Tax=Brachybacterium vulturis TaxID=2017484 RepID=UPI0037358834
MNDTSPVPGQASAVGPTQASGARPTGGDRVGILDGDIPVPPGRPVRLEPTPPGFWRVLLGAIVTVLAPLFGILVGTSVGAPASGGAMDPLYWGFFLGGLLGLLGLVSAVFGAASLIRHSRTTTAEEPS